MKRLTSGVWVLAAAKFAILLASTRLGYHRDELYFVAASKRLSPSYVDFQPVVPVLLRAERALFGDSLLGLRLIPAVAASLAVILAALIARELGGGRRAQLFAAYALIVVPLFFGMGGTLNTVVLETTAWMGVALVFTRVLRTEDPRWWPVLGVTIAVALLVKFTVLAYLPGLAFAILLSPIRRHVRTPWPWLGAAVIVVALTPSIVWQAQHSWAVVEFVSHQGTGGKVLGLGGRFGYLLSLAILPGPVALWLWIPGLRHLWRTEQLRPLAVTHGVALLVFLVAAGKGYYAAPGLAVLLAAGAVALDARPGWSPRRLGIALAATVLLAAPLFVAPVSLLRQSEDFAQATELSERIGWEELARNVGRVYHRLPSEERGRVVVLGANYTLSADVEFYARRFDLPPAGSGHNSAYLWRPPARRDRVTIAIGYDGAFLRRLYRHVERVGTVTNAEGVHGYDWGDPIFVARGAKLEWPQEWRRLKTFTA